MAHCDIFGRDVLRGAHHSCQDFCAGWVGCLYAHHLPHTICYETYLGLKKPKLRHDNRFYLVYAHAISSNSVSLTFNAVANASMKLGSFSGGLRIVLGLSLAQYRRPRDFITPQI